MPVKIKNDELAYIAGIIDSDGYVGIVKNGETRRKKITFNFRPTITITQVQPEAIGFIQEKIGGKFGINKQLKNSNWKNQYRWGLYNRKEIKEFLEKILPYLKIKKRQAEMVIKYCEEREKALSTKIVDRDIKGRFSLSTKHTYSGIEEKLWFGIKQLNQTGII